MDSVVKGRAFKTRVSRSAADMRPSMPQCREVIKRSPGLHHKESAHLDTTTEVRDWARRNAGFIRQGFGSRALLPDKSGVPVVVSRCGPTRSKL